MQLTCECGKKFMAVYQPKTRDYAFQKGAMLITDNDFKPKRIICRDCIKNKSARMIRRPANSNIGRMRACLECGEDYEVRTPAQKYCPSCRLVVALRKSAESRMKIKKRKYVLDS